VANDITIRVTAKDDASRVLDGVDKKARGLGDTFASVGKIAGGFIAANVVAGAAQTAINFLGDSINAAKDLGESINAVNVIFGESAGEILAWGKTAATQAGLSQRAFNQLATPLGAMLRNSGMGMDEVASKTIELTKRAADMASVFNTDVEDALEAIQAGLRGELDPLERFGVKLSAAAVEAKALAMTGKELVSSLTDQEKAAARVALIFEQTAAVQGDFANTSGELANAQRIAAARTEELQAQIGEKLIPVMLKVTEIKLALVTVIAEQLIPALNGENESVQRLVEAYQKVAEAIEFLQPVFELIFEDIRTRIDGFVQQFSGVVGIVEGVVDLVSSVINGEWRAAWDAMVSIVEGAVNTVVGTLRIALGEVADQMIQAGKDIVNGLIKGIKEKLPDLENLLDGIAKKIENAIKNPLGIFSPSRVMKGYGENIMEGLGLGMSSGYTKNVTPVLAGATGNISGAFAGGGAAGGGGGAGVGGGFAFNVTNMNIYEKDDREVKDVAFAVTATMSNEVRRRGYLLSSSPPTTSTGVKYGRP